MSPVVVKSSGPRNQGPGTWRPAGNLHFPITMYSVLALHTVLVQVVVVNAYRHIINPALSLFE